MTDRRLGSDARGQDAGRQADEAMRKDLEALRRDSDRNLPNLDSIVRTATRRPRTWEEYLMATFANLTRRPWTSAALAGALAAIALLVVPLSYMRTTGHTVALTLSGGHLDADHVRGIALQFKKALHADGVAVRAEAGNGATTFTLSSTVPNGAGVNATAAVNALSSELTRLGYAASATVTPVRERVTGSVYAYARDQIITVDIDHKSAAQIEAEIRQDLANAGIPNAQVSVSEDNVAGKEALRLKVEAQKTATGPGGGAGEPMPQLVLEKNGQPLGGKGFTVREEKRRSPEGTTLTLIVQDSGKSATITIPHVDTMSDAAITAAVESQLKSAGIEARVTTTGGRVQIEKR